MYQPLGCTSSYPNTCNQGQKSHPQSGTGMAQFGVSTATPVVQQPQPRVSTVGHQAVTLDKYQSRKSKILGILQLLAASIGLVLTIAGIIIQATKFGSVNYLYNMGTAIWCTVMFGLSGSFALCAASTKERPIIIAHSALAGVSGVFAIAMLCFSIATLVNNAETLSELDEDEYGYSVPIGVRESLGLSVMWMLTSVVALITSVWNSALGCQVLGKTRTRNDPSSVPLVVIGKEGIPEVAAGPGVQTYMDGPTPQGAGQALPRPPYKEVRGDYEPPLS